MISRDLIGRETKPVKIKIEDCAVRRFAEAAGIPFDNQVPPTFVGSYMGDFLEGFNLMQHGVIHGEQKITYDQPVSIGDWITFTRRIKDISERTGKLGKMILVVIETVGCNPTGEQMFNIISTVFIPDWREGNETPTGLSG